MIPSSGFLMEAGVKTSRRALILFAAILCALIVPFVFATGRQIEPSTYSGLKWRLVGPFRGGRVITVAGVPSQPNTYYFGAVAGGVWKTTDGGNTQDPLFEKQSVSSIGAIAISDSDPNVIYAGTGRHAFAATFRMGTECTSPPTQGKRGQTLAFAILVTLVM